MSTHDAQKTVTQAMQMLFTTPSRPSSLSTSHLPLSRPEFHSFKTCGDPLLSAMRDAAERYAVKLFEMARTRGPHPWLVFLGTSGIGKTMLAKEVFTFWGMRVRSYAPRPGEDFGGNFIRSGCFIDMRRFMRRLRSGECNISESIEEVVSDGFVVLDDAAVGIEEDGKRKAFDVDVLDQIVAGRCGKPTIFTCNFFFEQIATSMDSRIASRLLRNGSVEFTISGTTMDFNSRTASEERSSAAPTKNPIL